MKPYSSHHRRLLLYVDAAPYTTPTSSPAPILPNPSPGHSSLPPLTSSSSSSPSPTSERTLRQPLPLTRPPYPPFDSSMALTFLVLLSFLFFMGFFSIYFRRLATADDSSTGMAVTQRSRRLRQAPPQSLTPTSGRASCSSTGKGVDPTIIRSLPSYAYCGSAKYQIDCPVCLSEFEEAEIVKVIPYCDHVFHSKCIDIWLQSHVSCPVCRATQLLGVRSWAADPPTVDDQSPTAAVAEGETSRSVSLDSGEWEAAGRTMMRCNSCSLLWLESSGGRRSSLYRTFSF